jgi:Tol biopolymer transport system component
VKGTTFAQLNHKYALTVTVTGISDTQVSCAAKDANLIIVNDAAKCTFTGGAVAGMGEIVVTPSGNADPKTWKVAVGDWALSSTLGGGVQYVDVTGANPALTLFDTATVKAKQIFTPMTSPDRSNVVYVDFSSNGPSVVDIYQTDGTASGTTQVGNAIALSSSTVAQVRYPSWCPDGKTVIYVGTSASGDQAVWKLDTGTFAMTKLVDEGSASGIAMFAPHCMLSGKVSYHNVNDETVWVMNLDGTGQKQLVGHKSIAAFCSANGKTCYYSDGVDTFVSGTSSALFSGYVLFGLSHDEKYIALMDDKLMNSYVADPTGGTPTLVSGGATWIAF